MDCMRFFVSGLFRSDFKLGIIWIMIILDCLYLDYLNYLKISTLSLFLSRLDSKIRRGLAVSVGNNN